MRFSLFEQAAAEASYCAKQIDGEIEELKARKQVLDGLMQHLSMALPMLGGKTAASVRDVISDDAPPAPAAETTTDTTAKADSWTNFMSSIATSDTARQSAESLSFANPAGIRERVLG